MLQRMPLFYCIYKTSKTKQKILWITFPYQSIRKVSQILAGKKVEDKGGCPLLVTLSRSEGSVSMGREMLRCGSA